MLWLLRAPVSNFLIWVSDRQALTASIQQYGIWGPVVLFALLILQVFLALIPGHTLILAGGYVYGFASGLFIALSSTVLGSQIAFWIARRYGRAVVERLADPVAICRWDRLATRQGTLFYFFVFVLPFFPSDLMCYVAGLGTISSRRFLIANFLGRFVCAAFITLIGSNALQMPVIFWIATALGITAAYVGWRVYLARNVRTHDHTESTVVRDDNEKRAAYAALSPNGERGSHRCPRAG